MKAYLLSILSAGLLCAFATSISKSSSGVGKMLGLICGLFMTMTILSPLVKWNPMQHLDTFDVNRGDSEAIIQEGQVQANSAMREVISQQCRTYIVEKANAMGVDIDAQFILNDNDLPAPTSVTITGPVSPYAKSILQEILSNDLGIPKEQQIWK